MIATYSRFCSAIAKVLIAANLLGLAVIVIGLALQVFTRYALNTPIQATDEIAQNALTWMCFLGAAFVYRERGHIEIDFFIQRMPKRLVAVIGISIEIAIIVLFLVMIDQIASVAPTMAQVAYGTLLVSKFHLQYLPVLISAVVTILFSIEHITSIWRGSDEPSSTFTI